MRIVTAGLVLGAGQLVPPSGLGAESLDFANDLLAQADRARGRSAGLEFTNKLEDFAAGKTRTNVLEVKIQGRNSRVDFQSPPRAKGNILLMSNGSIWFFKKGTRNPFRLTPRQRLLGQASYGDILMTRYAEDYKATKIEKATHAGTSVYILDLKAAAGGVTYDRIRYFVDPAKKLGIHAEFYALSGKLLKKADFSYAPVKLGGENAFFLSKTEIFHPDNAQRRTVIHFSRPQLKNFPAATFNKSMVLN